MLLPFKKKIDRAFRQDRNLPRKLLGAVVVGLSAGLGSLLTPSADPLFCACVSGAMVVISVTGVLALSLSDIIRRRVGDGQSVNPVLRLYFASGRLSLALWVGTIFAANLLVCILWPL